MSHAALPDEMQNIPDLESRGVSQGHPHLRLWLRLLACSNLVEREIRSRLRIEHETTLPRFDLMVQLLYAPTGMSMSELSRHMMVSNGNITAIAVQLEKEGLIRRTQDAADRRSSLLSLTASGRRQIKKMAASHDLWIQNLFNGLSEKSQKNLYTGLGELKGLARSRLPPRA